MAADLSKLSDEDLVALKSGDLTKVSNQGLLTLRGSMPGPSAAEKVANDPVTKGAQAVLETTPAELAAANPAVRLGLGGISPALGAAQLAAEGAKLSPVPFFASMGTQASEKISELLKNLDELKKRGTEAISGSPAGDITNAVGTGAEVAGNIAGFGPMGKVEPAAGALGRIAQGVLAGTVGGAATPTTDQNYWGSKGGQMLIGALIGGAIPAAIEGGKAAYGGARNVYDMLTPEGAKNILTKYQIKIIGEQNLPQVINALKYGEYIGPPTAAEALVGTPAGSPIAAHQAITARTPGGVSAQFGERKAVQLAAMEKALAERDAVTAPMRNAALDAANQGGVKATGVEERIGSILQEPGKRASTLVQKVLGAVNEKLASIKNPETGNIDARDLYTVRKEIGNTIQSYAKETSNWDKKLAAGLERDIQKSIDDAIETAGGVGWKKYLSEFGNRSQAIENELARRKAALIPPQRTDLQGGADVAGQMRVHGPQLLSRPMMVTNWLLRKMGENVEKRIDPEAARRYLDPQALATELEKFSPEMRRTIVQDLIKVGRLPAIAGASSEAAQNAP